MPRAEAKPNGGRVADRTLSQAKKGDRGAQAEVLRHHQAAVYRLLARMMVGRPAEVEDLAQESLLKVLRGLPRFDPNGPASLSTWVLTIATRVAIDALRKKGPPVLKVLPEEIPQDGPQEVTEARDLQRRVEAAMASLPEGQRAVLILRAYHDLDYPEIAKVLEVEVGTVKSRLSRARTVLKQAMKEEAL